jgi:hypothetical protein
MPIDIESGLAVPAAVDYDYIDDEYYEFCDRMLTVEDVGPSPEAVVALCPECRLALAVALGQAAIARREAAAVAGAA